ncbi:hypothetical protein GIB67_017114 [Kingdonia uniflora]|uniref:Peptidase S26 domain-containing protein n=1 Tax=Kingdonia uniflora TaxID=39325 RepID=A0A7J7NCD6_9MAGN|nr:hypothetical protein GIB67_017114 [Kingdonia uniflora]
MSGLRFRFLQFPWKTIAKDAFDGTMTVAKFLSVLHLSNTYICTPTVIYGASMLPTINSTGDLLLADRLSARFGRIRRGDIIIARSPENPRKIVTKRVMGIEDDQVTYLVDPGNINSCKSVTVPKGNVWIQGDNTYVSNDSRKYGAIPYGLIEGKVFFRVWPLKNFGSLSPGSHP